MDPNVAEGHVAFDAQQLEAPTRLEVAVDLNPWRSSVSAQQYLPQPQNIGPLDSDDSDDSNGADFETIYDSREGLNNGNTKLAQHNLNHIFNNSDHGHEAPSFQQTTDAITDTKNHYSADRPYQAESAARCSHGQHELPEPRIVVHESTEHASNEISQNKLRPRKDSWTPNEDAIMTELSELYDFEEFVPDGKGLDPSLSAQQTASYIPNGQNSQHHNFQLSSHPFQPLPSVSINCHHDQLPGNAMYQSVSFNSLASQPLDYQHPPATQSFSESGELDGLIELLDDDDAENSVASKKRKWPADVTNNLVAAKYPSSGAEASALARSQHMPDWMKQNTGISHSLQNSASSRVPFILNSVPSASPSAHGAGMLVAMTIPTKPGFIPTWKHLLPRGFLISRKEEEQKATQRKSYALSVLNVNEFTISGVSPDGFAEPSSVQGLRAQIRHVSRDYGKATFERDSDSPEGGKWRIPLGAYQAFYSYLTSLPRTTVQGIPQAHLNIAMLGRQRLEKGYPSVRRLIHIGVPIRLANTLAPFQRGGVDFVYERHGRALIADEMGLGKTIQAIASLAIYHEDWPVLVLTPSGARYHWQNEFFNWLGPEQSGQKLLDFGREGVSESQEQEDLPGPRKRPMSPLFESQIHVLTSGASPIIPSSDTKVVIVSYGLAPKLAEDKKLVAGMFKCAIVDESHMLKNKNSKRTKGLMPVLAATKRCILLSGTPAFARPMELWPQMKILGSAEDPTLTDEHDFIQKYVKGRSKNRLAELHTVLTGTLMIRRMKNDILKQLPPKVREQALVNILNDDTRQEFRRFLEALSMGKGALAKIARSHEGYSASVDDAAQEITPRPQRSIAELKAQVQDEIQELFVRKRSDIDRYYSHQQSDPQADPNMIHMGLTQALNGLRAEIDLFYRSRLNELKKVNEHQVLVSDSGPANKADPNIPSSRKAALIEMYKRTGQVKIPLVAEMLKLWLENPAKGKLCIFAHHITVLNEIGSIAGLSNEIDSTKKFIRIDGATNPKQRQEHINAFQKDPSIRVALLGITAAGVAVTLTAASTVWFAELFWTPALLIQAEDRCHRIGQQARCRCLYIVAKGTLDEILWKHVEKKFRDLGEFVEGKEKMKIVVHKTYRGSDELRKSLEVERIDFDEDEEADPDQIDESAEELESQLHQDIEELEREEQEMLKVDDAEDDDGDGEAGNKTSPSGNGASGTTAGSSETEAICLIDDEDDETPAVVTHKSLQEGGIKDDREFPELKLYRIKFPGPSCGLDIALFKGRVVVTSKAAHIDAISGGRPNVGDILLACNNDEVAPNARLPALLQHFNALMQRDGMIEFMFAEDKEFSDYFTSRLKAADIERDALMDEGGLDALTRRIASLPTYTVSFDGVHDYGFGIESLESVIVVTTISLERLQTHGTSSAPSVGDILLSVNGKLLGAGVSAKRVKHGLDVLKARGMGVEMTFAAADDDIVNMVMNAKDIVMREASQFQRHVHGIQMPIQPAGSMSIPPLRFSPSSGNTEVIELLDD